jgi:hypothetical protein
MNTPSWINKTSCPAMPSSHKQIYRVNSRRVYIGNPSSSSQKKFILFYNIVGTLGSINPLSRLCLSPGDFTCQGETGERAGTQWLEIL